VNGRAAALILLSVAPALGVAGCRKDGCVGGDDGACVPPSACPGLGYVCADPMPPTFTMLMGATTIGGPKARGTTGDILLENGVVRVVLDAPGHPSGLAPTGGSIIDFALVPKPDDKFIAGDQINQIYQAAGLLPRDAVHYEGNPDRLIGGTGADAYAAAVFRGHLEANPRVTVVTRYELRACEPGVRVRTDLYNGSSEPDTLYLADGLFWGDNDLLPFVPGTGLGFRAPELDLRDIGEAWREWPFVAARTQAPPEVSYAIVPCDRPTAAGFNNPTLTASGVPLATTLPGDGIHLERFILAQPGAGLADAVSAALHVRAMVHGEPAPVTVTGRVVGGGTAVESRAGRAASLLFYEPAFGPDPDDPARRKPWTEAIPDVNGRITVALPPDRSYRVQPYAFGLPAAPATSFAVEKANVDLGDITIPASARLDATVTTAPGQQMATFAELVLVPVTAPAADVPAASVYGLFPGCDPMLGPPHGGSPACNRAISETGSFSLLIPPGHYYVYATRGPFATIDRAEIAVGPGGRVPLPPLVVESLNVLPVGALSGDFHVHGAASFDSAIPDRDRVVSFLAAGVDVVVATDHDVVTSYQATLESLVSSGRLVVIPGVEQTPNIPWLAVPGNDLPTTVGHFNFWPLFPERSLPRNGAPWDELREPGQIMDDIEVDPAFQGAGVRQLNHPFSQEKLGRDQGFMRAIGYDPRTPIASGASFAADVLLGQPGGPGKHSNLDWDVQEVMTGTSVANWLRYRALWFSMLSQGFVRAGTANSDTHALAVDRIGYPRNIVFGDHRREALDVARFDADIRKGHMQGTTGPVIDVTILDDGKTYRPGLDPIQVSTNAQLVIQVSAAPWVPVSEARVIVNGVVVKSIALADDFMKVYHFGTQVVTSNRRAFPLSSFLPTTQPDPPQAPKPIDAWLIVEAGAPLPDAPDVDGDGLPDVVESQIPRRPDDPDDRSFDYQAIAPGCLPVAFTNPFLINVDGGPWQAPGLP
jgi:hypothetical protein